MSKVCVPSPPHVSSSTPGQEHVDQQHFEDGKYVGRCSGGGQHNTDPSIVETVRGWFEAGHPGHPKGDDSDKGSGGGKSGGSPSWVWW